MHKLLLQFRLKSTSDINSKTKQVYFIFTVINLIFKHRLRKGIKSDALYLLD